MSFVEETLDLGAFRLNIKKDKGVIVGSRIMENMGGGTELKPEPLKGLKIDISKLTPFEKQVTEQARKVPPGRVTTYGSLAEAIGRPGAARAVGGVMARNPFPIIIPCHRVVRSDLTLGGFSGGVGKKSLLEAEGVEFEGDRVKREYLL